jgi:ferredoxin-nitrate reductase
MADNTAKTQCPYCGVGCGLEVLPPAMPGKNVTRDSDGTPIWQARGDRDHPSSLGQICVKGATIGESLHKDRLKHPMMRESIDQPFRRVSWEEALDAIATQIKTVIATQGKDAIAMYGSGQFQTQDYYVAQKLLKGCLGTNNFDANSRLCMSSAVSAYAQSFGADGPPCCYEDLDITDCAFLFGTNTAECHPIIFNRLRKNHKKNAETRLVVIDPRATETAKHADLHLAINPGTDIDLMHGIAHLLLQWAEQSPQYINKYFIDQFTDGFDDYCAIVEQYDPQRVADICGISIAQLKQAARYWGKANNVLSMWSMGLNQSSEGTAKARSLINLHLLTGQMGRPGAGPFSLTGQPNAMGGREAGGLAHLLPGYRFVANPEHRAQVEEFWKLPPGQISAEPGLTVWEAIQAMEVGRIGLFWVAATNPVVSLPDLERVKKALRNCPFVIHQECYAPTEMTEFAHLLLPAAQWSEKTGIMTNSERRLTLCPKFRTPPGEARPDWVIFAEVGQRLGFVREFAFNDAAEVYAEFVRLTKGQPCDQTGISHKYLETHPPIQWPAPKHNMPSPDVSTRLYSDLKFHTANGRAKFIACHSRGLAEPPDVNFPYVLTTGRLYGHWHTMSRTGRVEKTIKMHPHPFLEVHPRDANAMHLKDGDWVEVRSRRGFVRLPVTVTKGIAPGTVFVPMHWGALWAENAEANALTHPIACPVSKQPELKACAVQVIPIWLPEQPSQKGMRGLGERLLEKVFVKSGR